MEPHTLDQGSDRILCYPGDPDYPLAAPALPTITRLIWRNQRFVPPEGFEPPQGGEMPEGFEPPSGMPEGGLPGGGVGGPGGQSNALSQRFQENNEFAALIDEASARLQSDLIDSGYTSEVLQEWTTVLSEQASDLVSTETTQSESDSVAQALSGTSE